MPTVFVRGDLFTYPGLQALAHGCNCAGAMGRGIAVEFRRRFPGMFTEYKRRCDNGTFRMGDVFVWRSPTLPVVFNLATQKSWKTRAYLGAIEKSVGRMIELAGDMELAGANPKIQTIGLPRVGSGLGGLSWGPVRSLLESEGERTPIQLVVFEDYVPDGVKEES